MALIADIKRNSHITIADWINYITPFYASNRFRWSTKFTIGSERARTIKAVVIVGMQ